MPAQSVNHVTLDRNPSPTENLPEIRDFQRSDMESAPTEFGVFSKFTEQN